MGSKSLNSWGFSTTFTPPYNSSYRYIERRVKKGSSKGFFQLPGRIFFKIFFSRSTECQKFMECSNRVNYHHKLTNLPMTIIDIPLCPSSVPKNLFGVSCTNGQQTTENNIPQNFFCCPQESRVFFFILWASIKIQ